MIRCMCDIDKQMISILNAHALKAGRSEYDRAVAISAIAAARRVLESLALPPVDPDYRAVAINRLMALKSGYHDPDGIHTNGKGVIGALIDDLVLATG